ncbi:Uncharacterised protein [Vibrio cholerae]|uniref:Uncharacterized protein n=1 Tax=Vibrio cholerae TaxID=666 RepID=A0A655XWI7_VIBCL|nr:Uncharacterised protein [Vibrio cholerae]
MWYTLIQITVNGHGFHIFNAIKQTITQFQCVIVILLQLFLRDTERFTHTHNLVSRQSTRAETTFMTTTVHLCFKTNTWFTAYIQSTNTFRAVGFVRRKRNEINLHLLDINRYFTRGLRCINMEHHFT